MTNNTCCEESMPDILRKSAAAVFIFLAVFFTVPAQASDTAEPADIQSPPALVASVPVPFTPVSEPEADSEVQEPAADDEEVPLIADPLQPFNNAMFEFNDRLYFWLLKPVAKGYSCILPEEFRISINHFFVNLSSPVRIVNHLLQLNFEDAGTELFRFVFNSFAGIGGMGDMAKEALGVPMKKTDTGLTFQHYGIGHGAYIVLPFIGPSSVRDGIGFFGDTFLTPLSFLSDLVTFWEGIGIGAYERVNELSVRPGEYESFKEAAIDPYTAMRDAYVQYRENLGRKKDTAPPPQH